MGIITNTTGHAIMANKIKLVYVFIVVPTARVSRTGRSKSTVFKSEETYTKYMKKSYKVVKEAWITFVRVPNCARN